MGTIPYIVLKKSPALKRDERPNGLPTQTEFVVNKRAPGRSRGDYKISASGIFPVKSRSFSILRRERFWPGSFLGQCDALRGRACN